MKIVAKLLLSSMIAASAIGPAAAQDGRTVAKVGSLEVAGAFTKATLPGQPVGGGYFVVRNNGGTDDMLIAAESSASGVVELHEMAMQGDVMRMRKLDKGIAIPAGRSIELAPGGLHLMFMKLKAPFREGGSVPVTLTFEKAGKIEIALPVEAAGPGGKKH